MRKIGVITDAHANLPALEAALYAIELEGCDTVIHTGDAIGIGPYPRECLDLLLNRRDTHLLMGNHDEWFACGLPYPQPAWMSDEEFEHQQWTHSQLSPAMRAFVASWPYMLNLSIGSASAMFCHYARRDDDTGFSSVIPDPTPDDLDRLFGSTSDVIFYGHHHPVSDLQGTARYINPGALGCNVVSEARFAVVSIADDDSWDVALRSVPYDRETLFRAFEERNVPARDDILRIFFGQ